MALIYVGLAYVWLRNITNSAGIRLATNKFGGGAAPVTKFGAAALGGGAGVQYSELWQIPPCRLAACTVDLHCSWLFCLSWHPRVHSSVQTLGLLEIRATSVRPRPSPKVNSCKLFEQKWFLLPRCIPFEDGLRHSLVMSPLRRHIFVCFMAKGGFFFGPSSVKRGRTHIVLGWNM